MPAYHDFPKAELHLHLEGSIEPETLLELNPGLLAEEVQAHYRHGDFLEFLKNYVWVIGQVNQPEDYSLILRRLLSRLESQNVLYAEINLSVGVMLWRKQDVATIFEALHREAQRSKLRVYWIFDAVRQFGVEHARKVAELAAERTAMGVAGFGLGGDEERGPAEWFGGVCRFAREAGLRLAIHAGETTGPESVWGALQVGAERIGHGIRSIEDAALMKYLRDYKIPLEICIGSNVATGAVASLKDHPVRRIFDAGVPVVLNTDDPAMFHTSLEREYELAATEFGFSEDELRILAGNAFRYAFRRPERPKARESQE